MNSIKVYIFILYSASFLFGCVQRSQDINIRDLGAAGDGSDVTILIQQAIDEVHEKGGGLVRLPKGKYTK